MDTWLPHMVSVVGPPSPMALLVNGGVIRSPRIRPSWEPILQVRDFMGFLKLGMPPSSHLYLWSFDNKDSLVSLVKSKWTLTHTMEGHFPLHKKEDSL